MSEHSADSREAFAQDVSELPPLGAALRAARESRGESLSDIAMTLKLSVKQIEAIEAERFSELPGPAFVKGFVRNYGRHVGVHVEPMIAARWGAPATSNVELRPMASSGVALPASGERSRARKLLFPLLLALALVAALAWYFDGFDPHFGSRPAAVTGDANPVAEPGEVPPLHEGPDAEAMSEEQGFVVQPFVEPPAPIMAPDPVSGTPAPAAVPPPAVDVMPRAPVAAEALADQAAEPAVSGPGRVVFRFEGESWIDVRDNRDRRLYSGVGTAGSVRVVQGQQPFTLVIGNARALRLEHAGREVDLKPHTSAGGVARLTLE